MNTKPSKKTKVIRKRKPKKNQTDDIKQEPKIQEIKSEEPNNDEIKTEEKNEL